MNFSGISVTKLPRIEVVGGDVLHALKETDLDFHTFGEAYFSFVNYNHIKAWKKHNEMTMNLIVPIGKVKFVFFNNFKKEFLTHVIGNKNYARIAVPPGIWFGFKGIAKEPSLILNISNILHDNNEVERKDIKEIKFNW